MYPDELGPPPASSVSIYELGFGTVAGICAGVFLKKGAKALAFLFGGVFVLLQVRCYSLSAAHGFTHVAYSILAPHRWCA